MITTPLEAELIAEASAQERREIRQGLRTVLCAAAVLACLGLAILLRYWLATAFAAVAVGGIVTAWFSWREQYHADKLEYQVRVQELRFRAAQRPRR
jgi:membrane protein YdbS with pleckstrin-like domain